MFISPDKTKKGKEKFHTPILKIKNHSQIPNTQGIKKKLPLPDDLEERLKDNVHVIEFLNDSRFKRYQSRKRLKTVSDSQDTKSIRKQIFHVIAEKLKWKQQDHIQKTSVNKNTSLDSKLQKLQNIVGKIKQLNSDNIESLSKIKGQQIDLGNHFFQEGEEFDFSDEKQLSKSQLIIQRYKKRQSINDYRLYYNQYSGNTLKGEYRHPDYVKPDWVKSQTARKKNYENLQDWNERKKHSANRSVMNLNEFREREEIGVNCQCNCHGAKPLGDVRNV